ncbi:jg7859 [Pararge aegeria aegeria]|uniref:Jg7859 protein n=1 Tax=Pararge aegeria aegeria TaxID=348720 RepID=A0A8S4QP36_9NEOP|nr:jg7859 [Pararge aegeria aegeria]
MRWTDQVNAAFEALLHEGERKESIREESRRISATGNITEVKLKTDKAPKHQCNRVAEQRAAHFYQASFYDEVGDLGGLLALWGELVWLE